MEEKLVSVIIPIYKVEKYLKRCIDSVLNQTYKNLEIILVDDGSPDLCPKICDEYEERDKRIRNIHKINGGLSDARNFALDIACGEYITCIDSDDYVNKNYIKHLVYSLESSNADIAICGYSAFWENREVIQEEYVSLPNVIINNRSETFNNMLYGVLYDVSAWGKLYKKDLFNDIRYPYGYLYEDMGTTYKIIDKTKKTAFIDEKLYYYLLRRTGISMGKFNKKKMDLIHFSKEVLDFIERRYPENISAAKLRLIYSSIDILRDIGLPKTKEEKNFQKECYKYVLLYRKKLIFNQNIKRKYRFFLLISYLGINVIGITQSINLMIRDANKKM